MIYYISRGLVGPKLWYPHIEKLALAAVHAIQQLCHNISLRKTFVLADVNPFQFFFSKQVIGGKYNKMIFILQEFDLKFMSAKLKFLVFRELILELPYEEDGTDEESFSD